jgi:hypothetical protein
MSRKVYKLWRLKRWTEAYMQLSEEERSRIFDQMAKHGASVGDKSLIRCHSYWANEEYLGWGVIEYPDLEAALKNGEHLVEMEWWRYVEAETVLGIEW